MSEQNQERYRLEDGFFVLSDGTRVPAIGLLKLWSKVNRNYVELNYLYSIKSKNFVKGVVMYYDDDDDYSDGYNWAVIYRLNVDSSENRYILFETKIYRNNKDIAISAYKINLIVEDIDKLVRDEYAIKYVELDNVRTLLYNEQIDRISTQNIVLKTLLQLGKTYIETEKDDFEIPDIQNTNENIDSYNWENFKQHILYLRQPFDMFA